MSESRRKPPWSERIPTRVPGEGGIELEPMAGDLQLSTGLRPGEGPSGRRVATEGERLAPFRPGNEVPVSGVYDVVDARGEYLGLQLVCHAGTKFPPTTHFPADVGHVAEYEYRLAYEAAHLAPISPEAKVSPGAEERTIHRPGDEVEASGIYGVVDEGGNYLRYQRALVNHPHRPATETFPEFGRNEPAGAYGYVLQYKAEHLHPSGDHSNA